MTEKLARAFQWYANNSIHICCPILVVLVATVILLFNLIELYVFILFLLCLLYLTAPVRKKNIKISFPDIIVFVLFIFYLGSNSFSINNSSVVHSIEKYFIIFGVYCYLRLFFKSYTKTKHLIRFSSLLFIVLSVASIIFFILFEIRIHYGGFGELYNFKNLYKPLGLLVNNWSSFLLLFIGVSSMSLYYSINNKTWKRIMTIGLIILVFNLLIGFSRGTYLSFFVFLCLIVVFLVKNKASFKQHIKKILYGIIVLFILSLPYRGGVINTLRGIQTTSQQRSIEGRISLGEVSIEIFKQYPLVGVGSGNYSLAANEFKYEDDNNAFTRIASSSVFQLFVEKGLLGVLLWLFFVTELLYLFFKAKNKDLLSWIIYATLCAVIVREITFSSFFEQPIMPLWTFILVAILINRHSSEIKEIIINSRYLKIGIAFFCFSCLIITYFSYKDFMNRVNNEKFLNAYDIKNFTQAEQYIENTDYSTPYLINRALLAWKRYEISCNKNDLHAAKGYIISALKKNERDVLLYHNLAMILKAEGKIDSAKNILTELTRKYPNNSLYHISLGKLLYDSGDRNGSVMHFQKAIEVSPSILSSRFWKELAQSDPSAAEEIIKKLRSELLTIPDNPIALAKQGKILLSLSDTVKAKKYLEESVRQLPNLSLPWKNLGMIYLQYDKDTVKAIQNIKRANILNPHNFEPYHSLYEIYKKNGNDEKANLNFEMAEKCYYSLKYTHSNKFNRWYGCQTINNDIIPSGILYEINPEFFDF